MRLLTTFATIIVALTAGTAQASAQIRYDVGLLLGTTTTRDEAPVLAFDRGTTYQATFAWRISTGSRTAVSIEIPFLATPAFTSPRPADCCRKNMPRCT